MKKNRLLFVFATLIVAVAVFFSCQKAEVAVPAQQENQGLMLKSAEVCCVNTFSASTKTVFSSDFFGVTVNAYNDAAKTYVTISRGGGKVMTARYANPGLAETQTTKTTLFEGLATYSFSFDNPAVWTCGTPVTFSFYVSGLGSKTNTFQTGILTYYLKEVCTTTSLVADPNPVCIGSPVILTANVAAGEAIPGGTLEIIDGSDAVQASVSVTSEVKTVQFSYTPIVAGNAIFSGRYLPVTGFSSSVAAPLTVDAKVCGCTTGLKGEAVYCGTEREANFTFTNNGKLDYVKIKGGLTNFTGTDAVVNVPEGYKVTQSIPGGSSNRVITVEGPASCTPLLINIKWNSTNTGGVITGDWTAVDAKGTNLGSVAGLSCP